MPVKTLTVAQLIETLQQFPAEMPVLTASPSGDYWGRTLALPIDKWDTDVIKIRWSEYHRQWRLPSDSEENAEANGEEAESFPEDKQPFDAVILS